MFFFVVATIHHFAKKEIPNNMVNGNFPKTYKQLPHFEEESCETIKIFERFRKIYSFFSFEIAIFS
jgi:hypothetical protein